MNQDDQTPTLQAVAKHDLTRLRSDLEFVQLLADPNYIRELLWYTPYLNDPEFNNYLQYLSYLRTPEYISLVKFPHALQFLEILQQPRLHEGLKKAFHPAGDQFGVAFEQLSYMTLFQHTHELMPEKYMLPLGVEPNTTTTTTTTSNNTGNKTD